MQGVLRATGLAAGGGVLWGGHLLAAREAPLALRPPGAVATEDFLRRCIRCGLCVQACPFDTLHLSAPGSGGTLGQPFFTPRDVPCYLCPDVPCARACPSGALAAEDLRAQEVTGVEAAGVEAAAGEWDVSRARMGVAVVDRENCIAYWGIQCDACYRACPLLDHAIVLEARRNERTGGHADLLPVIRPEECTGCGLCEHACVTDKAAVTVLPRELVLGKVGTRYVKGWDANDEQRLRAVDTNVTTTTERSKRSALDYLNEGIEDDE